MRRNSSQVSDFLYKVMVKKQIKFKGKTLLSRLTGISLPVVGGVSWTPPIDEQRKASKFLTYLEDRRVLFHPYDMEIGDYVVQSVLDIRERLTADLEDINKSSVLGETLMAMRAACRKFLDEVQQPPNRRYYLEPNFINCMGELRALFGIHIARLAYVYDLEVGGELALILPPELE